MGYPFEITEHVIEGQHIREYPRATATQDVALKLCIKQYTPITNTSPQPGDVTIIAAHGTGYPKELYEPLWEDLLAEAEKKGVRIRSIWMADAANQGASGILNENHLGNDPSSYDHSRDIIHMINCFRDQMPQPIMGMGHSLGAVQILFASLFHPRLFASLIFIEPYVTEDADVESSVLLLRASTLKRDLWSSRATAIEKSQKVFKSWDPRVLDRWCDVGYRELPTTIYPTSPEQTSKDATPPVTLATTKYQEATMYTRLNTRRHIQLGLSDREAHSGHNSSTSSPPHDPLEVPDMVGVLFPGQQVYRPEIILAAKMVPHLRPSVLYVSGTGSPLYRAGVPEKLTRNTGTGFSGSGGMRYSRVRHVVIGGAGHSLPQEKVGLVAQAVAEWVEQEGRRWQEDKTKIDRAWEGRSTREKSMFPLEWMEVMDNLPRFKVPSKI
ncbi:hypothetical protein FE257_010858 [Aspergillus nanangensis]|uniref:AB hydrolase-1 domain-containing protein n=1 Tax=Aspergillus nanangensis TaxID=2582783 RepID=A0AAD4GY47_ASPNN|nr:hypothetical protein FE257_010858 [Aspergillus nanangensis]